MGGRAGAGPADLAEVLPVQAIDADVGAFVQGAPEARRRLLDWGVFHVEHDYLTHWRQFRRALLQRNAVLRENGPDSLLEAWDGELVSAAHTIDQYRRRYLEQLMDRFMEIGTELLGGKAEIRYQRGWPEGRDLLVALREGRESDRSLGYTRCGPQRADLEFQMNEARSRGRSSRGQQKLLGCAFILSQCRIVAEKADQGVALLVDEPAADLDAGRLTALMRAILDTPAQVFLASINPKELALSTSVAMFHVEHGQAKALL